MSRDLSRLFFPAVALVLGVWLSVRYVHPIALPFLLGLWLALAAEPMTRLLTARLRLPRWAASAAAVISFKPCSRSTSTSMPSR